MLKQEDSLFCQFKYQNQAYKNVKTGERIIMRTTDSWFMKIPDRLKMRCL